MNCILNSISFRARTTNKNRDSKQNKLDIPVRSDVDKWMWQHAPDSNNFNWKSVHTSIASEFKYKVRDGLVTTKDAVRNMTERIMRICSYPHEFGFYITSITAAVTDISPIDEYNTEGDDVLTVLDAMYGAGYKSDRTPDETDNDREWHIRLVNLDKVYNDKTGRFLHEFGKGTRFGHPDSGYMHHYAIRDAVIDRENAINLVDIVSATDTDVAASDEASHGLATCSVNIGMDIRSRIDSKEKYVQLRGVAPNTTYIPMRITTKIMDISDTSPFLFTTGCENLVEAIEHAIHIKADVISISMGTPSVTAWYNNLHNAVRKAVKHGMIVICAAGNFTMSTTVYPAAYDETVSVAAVDCKGSPWIGSAWGSHVDVCAPGHGVYRATVDSELNDIINRGSGTSYACAMVAGIALLWLRHNINKIKQDGTKQDLIDAVGVERIPILFKKALLLSCNDRPVTYRNDGDKYKTYGSGIVDAHALLKYEISSIE